MASRRNRSLDRTTRRHDAINRSEMTQNMNGIWRTGIGQARLAPTSVLATAVVFTLLLIAADLQAQDFQSEVSRTGTINEDLFEGAGRITIRATVNGDIMVMGGEVIIDSMVSGDVLVMGGEVLVGNDITGDVLAAGGQVRAEGTIDGDMTAMGGDVAVEFDSTGNVLAVGGQVLARGDIGGNLRMMGGDVTSRASVAGNLQAGGARVTLWRGALVEGNASLGGNRVRVDGRIGGDIKGAGRRVEIAGEVDGDVDIQAFEVKILSSARINGNLTYRSPAQADISRDAQILGDVTFIQSERPERMMGRAFAAAGVIWLSIVAGLVLLGVVLLLISPNLPFEAAGQIRKKPWLSLGLGLAVLVGGPVVLVILAATGVGLPLAAVLVGLYVVVLALGFLDFAILFGWWCARLVCSGERTSKLWRIAVLVAGLVVLSVIALIPGLGALVLFTAFVLGTGAVVLQGMAMRAGHGAMP